MWTQWHKRRWSTSPPTITCYQPEAHHYPHWIKLTRLRSRCSATIRIRQIKRLARPQPEHTSNIRSKRTTSRSEHHHRTWRQRTDYMQDISSRYCCQSSATRATRCSTCNTPILIRPSIIIIITSRRRLCTIYSPKWATSMRPALCLISISLTDTWSRTK